MSLSEIITTSIQAGTVNPARAGFGVPLLLAYHTAWSTDEVRRYTTFSQVAADFDADDLPYKWAAAIFAQNPRPTEIKIARLPAPASAYTETWDFTDHPTSTAITGSIVFADGTVYTINVAWDTDIATTLANLKTALDALAGIGTCTVTSPAIAVPAASNGPMFASSTEQFWDIRDTTADWGYDDRLDEVVIEDPVFYGVFTDGNSPKNMDKVARWAAANDRLAIFAPRYTKPSQFVSGEFTAGADYTALLANDAALGLFTAAPRSSFLEGGWAGLMLSYEPGRATWAFKRILSAGADAWSATERAAIENVGGNHYTEVAAVGITRPGKTFGGEFIDNVIGLAWLEARLQEGLFADLVNNPKIPYTDAGFAILTARVRAVLKEAEARTIIDSGWEVTILPVAEQASADRAARIVRGLEFTARLAGAVHQVTLVGTVTA